MIDHALRPSVTPGRAALVALALSYGAWTATPAAAQGTALAPGCTVGALNRSVRVDPQGRWILNNVPANRGLVRARAVCIENGVVRKGQSELFSILANGAVQVPSIQFDQVDPVPRSVILSGPAAPFHAPGENFQLRLSAIYPDGSTDDVTTRAGISWSSSNPRVVAVNSNGVATAATSGVALLSAIYEGTAGLAMVRVELSGDSDGDGIPDDVEVANGLDPNSPADGFEDADLDALSNRDELSVYGTDPRRPDSDGDTIKDGEEVRPGADHFVTNPLAADTDGDRFRDALEITVGSDPTNAGSYNLAASTASVRLAPSVFELRIDGLFAATSTTQQLTTIAVLLDGVELDVTSPTWGTTYSDSFNNCRVDPDGLVSPAAPGPCVVRAFVGSHFGQASGNVLSNPERIGALNLPGFANSVAVRGDYAFVAAGPAGLLVVDLADRTSPRLAVQIPLAGNGNDVRLAGDFAYVAGDSAGVHVVRISDPLHPVRVATVDTPGLAIDLAIDPNGGGTLYVADGVAGLAVIDVSDPLAPVLLGSLDTPGVANGVDVVGNLVVLTDLDQATEVIDVSVRTAPLLLASVPLDPFDSRHRTFDVQMNGALAYLATERGLRAIDLVHPANPVDLGGVGSLFQTDLSLSPRGVLFGAGTARTDAVLGLYDASRTGLPEALGEAVLDPSFGGDTTGVAIDARFLYATGTRNSVTSSKPGYVGQTRLLIGRYADFTDLSGISPTVDFETPHDGATATVGRPVQVVVRALDDVGVAEVRLLRDGQPLASDPLPPYTFSITPTSSDSSIVLDAVAIDFGGNQGTAQTVRLSVAPDAAPAVEILHPAVGEPLREGQFNLNFQAVASDDFAVRQLVLKVDGRTVATTFGGAASARFEVPIGMAALTFEAIATDDAGQVGSTTRTLPVEPEPAPEVAFLMPAAGSMVVAGTNLSIQFTVSDDDPFLRSVELFVDGVPTTATGTAPYSASYPVPGGISSLSIEVRATDRFGKTTLAQRTVSVLDPPPTVALVSPAAGTVLGENVAIVLGAEASDNLDVARVEFKVDGEIVGVAHAAPYEVPYTVRAGASSIRIDAVAFDSAGQSSASGATFQVETNGAPFVEIAEPAAGTEWLHGERARVAINADDPDGFDLIDVEIGGELVYQSDSAPFDFNYIVPPDVSSLLIRVTAHDRSGAASSVQRTVSVIDDPLTRVIGRIVDGAGQPVAGTRVAVIGHSGVSGSDGSFELIGVPTLESPIRVEALREASPAASYGESGEIVPERGGTTDVGDLAIAVASGGDLYDPTFDVRGNDDQRSDIDIERVHVEQLADSVRIRVDLGNAILNAGYLGYSAVLSFDLDRDPTTGERPIADLLGPHRPSGIGADLELRLDDQVSLDGVPFAIDDHGFTVDVPLERLGGARAFDLLVAVFDYNLFQAGGGGALTGQLLPETPHFLAYDMAPDFGRFSIPAQPDTDSDGLSSFREAELGTYLSLFDSDGDSVGDGYEVLYGLDPMNGNDGFEDLDGDGIAAQGEQYDGSDPTLADTDGDGIVDGDESAFGTWSTEADTDHDGIADGDETSTDRTVADSDRDGLLDGRELSLPGVDPNSFDTDGGGAGDGAEVELDSTSPTAAADDRRRVALTGTTLAPRDAAIAVDAQGNLHTVFIADHLGHEQLFYRMLGPGGTVRIDSTRLTLTLSPDFPALAVDGAGKVHVVWSDQRFGSNDVFYRVIDPSLDDQNGNAADGEAITVVADRRIGTNPDSDSGEAAIAVEASGRAHVVWSDTFFGTVRYARLSPSGATELAPRLVYEPLFGGTDPQPALVLDSHGGVHVTFAALLADDSGSDIGYLLIDGTTGSVLIAPTALTRNGNWSNGYPRPSLDSSDRLTVVYDADRREEARWLRIAPYRDDLSGDAADLAAIVDRPEQTLSFPDLPEGNRPNVVIDDDGTVHLVFYEANPWFNTATTLYYEAKDASGDSVVPLVPISDLGGAAQRLYEATSMAAGGGHVWVAWRAPGGALTARRIR